MYPPHISPFKHFHLQSPLQHYIAHFPINQEEILVERTNRRTCRPHLAYCDPSKAPTGSFNDALKVNNTNITNITNTTEIATHYAPSLQSSPVSSPRIQTNTPHTLPNPSHDPTPKPSLFVSSYQYAKAEVLLRPLHDARISQFPHDADDAHDTMPLLGILTHKQGRLVEVEQHFRDV
jgi:hypothetical protein